MNIFRIEKKSGTYSEALEAYGLANTLHKVFESLFISDVKIVITDKESLYEVTTSVSITNEMIERLTYFPLFAYIKTKVDSNINELSIYFNYPKQKEWRDEKRDSLQKVYKEFQGKNNENERDKKIKEIERIYAIEKSIDPEFDVYSQMCTPNNFSSFDKLYRNFFDNKAFFGLMINQILSYYSDVKYTSKSFEKFAKDNQLIMQKDVTALQLYNPNRGKGVKSLKANSVKGDNFNSSWISESMKISGALSDMICQLVKVGSSYDLKIFVPQYNQVNFGFKKKLIPDFKKYLKGNTPIKIDVLNILLLTQTILGCSEFSGRRQKVKNIVGGLFSVYQKDMGQNKAVMNIGFIQVPDFIEIGSKEENQAWIDILNDQRQIIASMDEDKGALDGLKLYRNFISGSGLDSLFDFMFFYSAYLSANSSNKKDTKAFTVESLNKIYTSMDTSNLKLMEIIANKGFQAIAKAIRKSTVSLQYTPKEQRKFEIRYGVAQTLQMKSKSPEDLASFIGEFICFYNADTARNAEKTGNSLRANVREDELGEFYLLLDKYPSRLIGALLASYGFALKAKEQQNEDEKANELPENIED